MSRPTPRELQVLQDQLVSAQDLRSTADRLIRNVASAAGPWLGLAPGPGVPILVSGLGWMIVERIAWSVSYVSLRRAEHTDDSIHFGHAALSESPTDDGLVLRIRAGSAGGSSEQDGFGLAPHVGGAWSLVRSGSSPAPWLAREQERGQ